MSVAVNGKQMLFISFSVFRSLIICVCVSLVVSVFRCRRLLAAYHSAAIVTETPANWRESTHSARLASDQVSLNFMFCFVFHKTILYVECIEAVYGWWWTRFRSTCCMVHWSIVWWQGIHSSIAWICHLTFLFKKKRRHFENHCLLKYYCDLLCFSKLILRERWQEEFRLVLQDIHEICYIVLAVKNILMMKNEIICFF